MHDRELEFFKRLSETFKALMKYCAWTRQVLHGKDEVLWKRQILHGQDEVQQSPDLVTVDLVKNLDLVKFSLLTEFL